MPRFCAAICCRNHRGRKLSCYPFPLHGKERLEKWLKNMKRDSWVPRKYQFLCSDHFTPDSLDIRWGIRYLKQTAIPTIFSLPEDDQDKDPSKKKNLRRKKLDDEKEVCLKAKSQESFASNELKKNTVNTNILPEHTELRNSSTLVKPPAAKPECIQNNILNLNLLKQDIGIPVSTLETSVTQDIDIGGFHTFFENLNSTTITLTTSNSEDVQPFLETQEVFEITANHLANPNFTNNSMEIKSAQESPFLLSTITQTVEELNTNKESVIAIFVPTENSKPINSFVSAEKETVEMEDLDIEDSLYKDVDYETEVLQIEHSYCRQDINKEHLWQKVSKLHSKITLLQLQEQQTLGRLKSLEALISQLKQENWLSEENVKIIENHFTTYEVTMI
ncbi:LOW QUALITY PROTEIN: THAP domain-containing protein 5-like [Canis lupus familiaris]|uniref:LOW QUALITY PROTEIN: THAP domain-containing protein 5-like n=1 Tax=Canis lupus dingo TaxID=286419 RepID=UPI0015F154F0|nr:LOW QUALITY PROTEIN: THAP domain-containing protein 5-like [Canis lupus dingo]XP_038400067.1 LOW QUALITY PROTEIN: THAP domain-containing protein 5-like [Canis lupus familiaris]XP_038528996.1 LOW QUALITY PROTEIN: THAP domain-containing protein 5-like [Canis lupus familiaris]